MGKQCFLSSLSPEGLHPHFFQNPFFRNHVIWTKDPSPTGVCFVAILSIQRPPLTCHICQFVPWVLKRLVVRLHNASLVALLPTLEPLRKDLRWKRPPRAHRNLRFRVSSAFRVGWKGRKLYRHWRITGRGGAVHSSARSDDDDDDDDDDWFFFFCVYPNCDVFYTPVIIMWQNRSISLKYLDYRL